MKKILISVITCILTLCCLCGCNRETPPGSLYTLEEAYENGWIDKEDLEQIAYYYNGEKNEDVENKNFVPNPKNPETLSEETIYKIKQTYLIQILKEPKWSPDGVYVGDYYGTYKGCVIVGVIDTYNAYDLIFIPEYIIGGVKFYDFTSSRARVWVQQIR